MKESIANLKAELKDLSLKIRELKKQRKTAPSGCGYVSGLLTSQIEYRYKHIARCMLRGTLMEHIESKHRDPKDSTHKYVEEQARKICEKILKGELYERRKEDIRISGQAPVAQPASRSMWTRVGEFCQLFW